MMFESILVVAAKMIKAEYLFGLFSVIAVVSSYYVVTEANLAVQGHDHAPYTHPELRADNNDVRAKIADVDSSVEKIQANVKYNRERGDLIQSQNNEAHERQEELLKQILIKLDKLQGN